MLARRALIVGGLLAAPAIARAQGQAGVALVIGNSKYKWEASLPNVKRDAPDVAKAFQALGLKTELVQDVGRDALRAAVDKFAGAARGANLAALYYAGHGASWDKDTYLVPEDADLANPNTVQTLLPVNAVSAAMKDASHRLLVFDNCRNNPADGWRQKAAVNSSQVSKIEQAAAALNGPNTLVLFSTAPGRVALDGPPGENSPFAAAFLRQLEAPSVDLKTLATHLRRDLLIETQCRQLVWDQSTYLESFPLKGSAARRASPQRTAAASSIVELPNAYDFAREKKLPLPPGLVGYRSPGQAAHAQKIGAFKYVARVPFSGAGSSDEPSLLLVLTVPEANRAEAVISTSISSTDGLTAGMDFRPVWRFVSCALDGDRLEFAAPNGSFEYQFSWREGGSGTYSQKALLAIPRGIPPFFRSSFTRLDG